MTKKNYIALASVFASIKDEGDRMHVVYAFMAYAFNDNASFDRSRFLAAVEAGVAARNAQP